jgi:RNA polymerase subunit RPABC4/transcription elongation factor Spt4
MTNETPNCRICGTSKSVAVWDPEHPEHTICLECCGGSVEHHDGETGHQFYYEPYDGHMCRYCGSKDYPSDWGSE